MKFRSFIVVLFASVSTVAQATMDVGSCLTSAYEMIDKVEQGVIYFKNGEKLTVGQRSHAPFTTVIQRATVADQLSQSYPLGFTTPKQYEDAGRLRDDRFFKLMYGANAGQVQKNLVPVTWKPSGTKIQFNKINGAATQLAKVGNEIAQYPELKAYVKKSLGSFVWRPIAGTNRLSTHSFGIAVDFELPKHLHKYWRWSGCKTEDKICPYPQALLQDKQLHRVVQIFEKHGFIWGGKWASYDSPHFEYRPELLIKQCRV